MTPGELALLLCAIGVVLLIAEAVLPTHGVLGLLGVLAFAGAIGACFWINQWLGLGVFLGALAASPLIGWGFVTLWPKTFVGRRMILQPVQTAPLSLPVSVGQTGVAVSRLGPVGECDFGEHRLEVVAERGFIEPRQQVKVIAISGGKPVVRVA
jgi:membrane-bound ClpP family serine protease